jgi:hypothetical protein
MGSETGRPVAAMLSVIVSRRSHLTAKPLDMDRYFLNTIEADVPRSEFIQPAIGEILNS